MPKTWKQKFEGGAEPHVETLEKSMFGMQPGDRMLISSPREIAAEVSQLREGETLTVAEFRSRLAHKHGAQGTCPITTSMFLRIVAEHSEVEGLDIPFWRAIDEKSPIWGKLSFDPQPWIERRRAESKQPV